MTVLDELDRFHLVEAVIDRVQKLRTIAAYARQAVREKLIDHRQHIARYGKDMPEIRNWTWSH